MCSTTIDSVGDKHANRSVAEDGRFSNLLRCLSAIMHIHTGSTIARFDSILRFVLALINNCSFFKADNITVVALEVIAVLFGLSFPFMLASRKFVLLTLIPGLFSFCIDFIFKL